MTVSITEFISARLREDEAAARAAIDPEHPGTHWRWVNDETDEPIGKLDEESAISGLSLRTVEKFVRGESIGSYVPSPLPAFVIYAAEEVIPGAGDHIARHDPARVLREVTAKRAILDLHQPEQLTARLICDECSDGYEVMEWAPDYPCDTVRAIALVYSDHPDFDPKWSTT